MHDGNRRSHPRHSIPWPFLLAGLTLILTACGPRPGALQTYRTVGDFQLIERSGNPVSRADLTGRIWVANFFFAGCLTDCSRVMDRMAEIQARTQARPDIQLVSFTTDPRSDTPDNLRKFAAQFDANPERWWFLTGDRKEILRIVVHSFLMPITRNPRDQADLLSGLVHSDKLALVDQHGVVRAYFDGLNPDTTQAVLAAIDRLTELHPPTSSDNLTHASQ